MPIDGAAVVKRYEKLRADRYNFDNRWEEMAPYIAPSRRGIITQWTPGDKQTRGVYDSTSMMAAEQMAMFIAGHIINPSQKWFELVPRDPDLARVDAAREWCEESRDRMLARFSASAFYAEAPESLIDYGGFGTGFLLTEEAPQPVNRTIQGFRGFYFRAEKTGRFVIQEGPDGMVDTAYREFELTARVAQGLWPDSLSEGVRLASMKEPDRPYKFVHGVYPRATSDQYGQSGALKMPWVSCWVEMEAKHVVKESGYREFPAAVPRYQKTPGEVYGRGRGDIAFPDTSTLNTAKRMGLEDWALKIKPPIMMRNDSVIGTLRLVPGGPTSVNTRGQAIRDVIMPWETGSRPEVSQIKEEELRRSIREIFFVDIIRQLLEAHKSEMSAYEFAKKIELLFRIMGPVYGRMEWEFLTRLIDTAFDVMFHAKEFSPLPDGMLTGDGQVDVNFSNPLARAQRSGDAEALLLAVSDLSPLTQFYPQILDRLDPDKTADGVFFVRGVPARWTRSDKEVAALRQARAEQEQAENSMAQVGAAAEAAGKAAPMVKALTQKTGGPAAA